MTLIVNRVWRDWVTQASDRRVSSFFADGTTKPFDSTANKTLLVVMPDALVSVGFTGLAYLDGQHPTDHWLAERFWGGQLPLQMGHRDGAPQTPILPLDAIERRVLLAIEEAYERKPPDAFRLGLTVSIAGWCFKRGHWRPFLHFLSHPGKPGKGALHRFKQFGDFAHASPRHLQPLPQITVMPRGLVAAQDLDQFCRASITSPYYSELRMLADLYRKVAINHQTVSQDFLAVTIPPVSNNLVVVRYHAVAPRPTTFDLMGITVSEVVSFSPWVVSPSSVTSPMMLVGRAPIEQKVGPLTIKYVPVEAPRTSGLLSAMVPLPRRLWA